MSKNVVSFDPLSILTMDLNSLSINYFCLPRGSKSPFRFSTKPYFNRSIISDSPVGSSDNVAVCVGKTDIKDNNLVVIDLDILDIGYNVPLDYILNGLLALFELTDTYTVTTPRGYHVYCYVSDVRFSQLSNRKLYLYNKVIGDLKVRDGYVVSAFSQHPSSALYTPLNNTTLFDIKHSDLSDLDNMFSPPVSAPVSVSPVSSSPSQKLLFFKYVSGSANNVYCKHVAHLYYSGYSENEALTIIRDAMRRDGYFGEHYNRLSYKVANSYFNLSLSSNYTPYEYKASDNEVLSIDKIVSEFKAEQEAFGSFVYTKAFNKKLLRFRRFLLCVCSTYKWIMKHERFYRSSIYLLRKGYIPLHSQSFFRSLLNSLDHPEFMAFLQKKGYVSVHNSYLFLYEDCSANFTKHYFFTFCEKIIPVVSEIYQHINNQLPRLAIITKNNVIGNNDIYSDPLKNDLIGHFV